MSSPDALDVLAEEVHAWVDANWDTSLTVRAWWRRLVEAGYAHPTWPEGMGGGGRAPDEADTVMGVLARRQVVGPSAGLAVRLTAPTLFEHGHPDQVATFVRAIALGEAAWCQLFSEPGSGSDLASLGTSAVLDGDEWVVTGQKVWSSGADTADLGMLLARTNLDAPKRHGITLLAIDMGQPGVEVRPLRQMNGQSAFCEVFLTGARVPADRVVGEVDGGWRVARTTLFHERRAVVGAGRTGLVAARPGGVDGDLDRAVGEVIERAGRTAVRRRNAIRGGALPAKAMVALARDRGVAGDPVIRQDLARYVSQVRVNGWTARRSAAARGRLTGADGSIAKVTTARICQRSRDLSYAIVGAQGLLDGPESPLGGDLQRVGLASPGTRIGGGTDEIQLSVLGERALGLPRAPGDDRDVLERGRG